MTIEDYLTSNDPELFKIGKQLLLQQYKSVDEMVKVLMSIPGTKTSDPILYPNHLEVYRKVPTYGFGTNIIHVWTAIVSLVRDEQTKQWRSL